MEGLMFPFLLLVAMVGTGAPEAVDDLRSGAKDWASIFKDSRDENKDLAVMNAAMDKKIESSMKRAENSMIRSKKMTSYVTISQDVHLSGADETVNIQKMNALTRLSRFALQYPWVSLRKMTVMWKTGVSNNVKWGVKMSFIDRRDNNDDTKELFMMEFPVSDNFIMMMAPGYTAYMHPAKGMLPWRFLFDFPDGEFTPSTVFGTLKIKLEIDQFKDATQVPEITPLVKFTRVQPGVEEPTLRWMSKGKWYQSSATDPIPKSLETITSAAEDLNAKMIKFLAFLGFDPVRVNSTNLRYQLHNIIDPIDLRAFEYSPLEFAKKYAEYTAKYKEIMQRALTSSVYVN